MAVVKGMRACADCGTLRPAGKSTLPQGQYRCHPCRRLRPAGSLIEDRKCAQCQSHFQVKHASDRRYCVDCVDGMNRPSSHKWRTCVDCGAVKKASKKSLPEGLYCCQPCRRKRPGYTGSGTNSHGTTHGSCKVCGELRPLSAHSRGPGELTCQKCRRIAWDERKPVAKRSGWQPHERTTTQRGLGRRHQLAVWELRRNHVDGSPCDWCGRPMYLDRTRNWDYDPDADDLSGGLQGDHSLPRSRYSNSATDRLLHRRCNNQRGDGFNDHLAWINHRNSCDITVDDTEEVG